MQNNMPEAHSAFKNPNCPICSDEPLPSFAPVWDDASATTHGVDVDHPLILALKCHATTMQHVHDFKRNLSPTSLKEVLVKALMEEFLHEMGTAGKTITKMADLYAKTKQED